MKSNKSIVKFLMIVCILGFFGNSFAMETKEQTFDDQAPIVPVGVTKKDAEKNKKKKKKKKAAATVPTAAAAPAARVITVPAGKPEESKLVPAGAKLKATELSPDSLCNKIFACIATNDAESNSLLQGLLERFKKQINKPHPTTKQYPVHFAAEHNNVEALKLFRIVGGCNFSIENSVGSALHMAALHNSLEAFKYLVEVVGLKPNEYNACGEKPIHYAACHKALKIINYLLENKHADVEEPVRSKGLLNGASPLILAAQHGAWPSIDCLLRHGANLCAQTVGRVNCLEVAADAKQLLTIKLILARDKKNKEEKGPGYNSIVNLRDSNGHNILDYFSFNGDCPMISLVINHGAIVNPVGARVTPLIAAALREKLEATQLLLTEHNACPNLANYDGMGPVHVVAINGNVDIMKLLVKNRANPNLQIPNTEGFTFREYTPLILAVLGNHFDMVKYLVQTCNVDCDVTTSCCKKTALFMAFHNHFKATAEYLIDHGANTNIELYGGKNLLHDAADNGWVSVMEKLVAQGFTINEPDADGNTALYYAGKKNHTAAITWLLEHGADVRFLKPETKDKKYKKMSTRILGIHAALGAKVAAAAVDCIEVKASVALVPALVQAPAEVPAKKPAAPKAEAKAVALAKKPRIVVHDHLAEQYPKLDLKSSARKFIEQMSELESGQITPALMQLNVNNFLGLDIKKLKSFKNCYRVRRGDYRIIYSVNGKKITVITVGKRENVYE